MPIVAFTIDYLKTVNYALFHNGIPVCHHLEIKNVSSNPIKDIRISCTGDYVTPYESEVIGCILPDEAIRMNAFCIKPDPKKLAFLTERAKAEFTLTATSGTETLLRETYEWELMPYDHWTGTTLLPQTLVSFITPNHPVIRNLVLQSAKMLKAMTGSSVLSEYQSGNSNDVRRQVAAVFAALHGLGIIYRAEPPSYESTGQRITLPDQVVIGKIGNCLELTLLMASVLEAIGINTLVVLQKGHAYLGVWLVDDCYLSGVCDDASFIEKKCTQGIDEMLVVECTQIAQEETSFEGAVKLAERNLAQHDLFGMFIDVKRSRLERIRPLPVTTEGIKGLNVEEDGIPHEICDISVEEHDRYDLSRIATDDKEKTKFDIWERKLLDFSLRNSLLNLSMHRRAVQFISFDVNRIEDHLQDGKEYEIAAKPNVEFTFPQGNNIISSKLQEPLHELVSNDIEHHLLHTYLPESETKNVMKNIYRAARNTLEETGANSLFIAIGTLRWFETEQSTTPRYAPLLLLPVEMVYKKGSYFIRTRDEEIALNITLMEFLRQNHDITIHGLNPLPTDESGVDVPLIFAIVRDALKTQKRWDVEEECVLGTFSFSKFLMWNDIHSHRDLLAQNNIINSLVANRLTWTPQPATDSLHDIDGNVSPANTALPVAVDSSQMAAVIEGGNGNSFILYGPPGTGKSQTITNLIANALYHGKRVLFVAEKMAALSVVQSRLAKIGLDPFCLELHSNKSTKRHVLEQLAKALNVTHIVAPSEYAAQAEKIFAERKELIAYMNALHTPDDKDGLSLYDCIVRYDAIRMEPLRGFRFDDSLNNLILQEGTKSVEELLGSKLQTIIKLVGQPMHHPLNGLHIDRETLQDSEACTQRMQADAETLTKANKQLYELNEARPLRERILRDNNPALLREDAEALRQEWRAANAKWFIPRFFALRTLTNRLRTFNAYLPKEEVKPLIDDLVSYHDKHDKIHTLQGIIKYYFGTTYAEDEVPERSFLEAWAKRINHWAAHANEMRDWIHWVEYATELRHQGLGCVADALEQEELQPATIKEAFLKALFRYKAEQKIAQSPCLATFEGMLFDEKTAAYRHRTEEFQLLTQKELYARLAAEVPRMTDNATSGSELGILNRNISNGGRGQSLRDLFDRLPTILPRLCPCMLMSPMSVAQYIDLKSDKFDLVIFDEASQMPTSEAVGAIARGKALIVVGDPKQMPPTSFFTSTNVDEEEACIDDMESILEDCRTLDMPSLQLSWHYRSRHESLIAFSNNEYYDGSLITFPSVDDQRTKVHHIPVTGFYDKGGKRSNRAEAEAIVNEIVHRLRDKKPEKPSIGVIAFSVMQQGLIEDILQETLDKDKTLQEAAAAMYEPIFIKNLENVQGDERDVVLFSVGYGPDKGGKISMNFGPLNNAGGERRLNVAVSRARQEMYIYSTLRSSDIDLRRSKARGVEGLKHFLQYAETQNLPIVSTAVNNVHPSVIAEHIADELRQKGYRVTTNVGRSHFRVDVAVERNDAPGTYGLGILLDGENYRDTHTTRDREVVQPSMLQNLHWQVMRIWSVDWFNNKERVMNRILEKLVEMPTTPQETPEPKQTFDISDEEVEETATRDEEYVAYNIESAEAKQKDDFSLMQDIIQTEQPITFSFLCRRVNALRQGTRVSPALQKSLKTHLHHFFAGPDGALWMNEETCSTYTAYRPNSGRDITEIPEVELVNAITEALVEQVALSEENLTLVASKKLGFARRGANVDAAFTKVIAAMKESQTLENIGDNLRLATDKSV